MLVKGGTDDFSWDPLLYPGISVQKANSLAEALSKGVMIWAYDVLLCSEVATWSTVDWPAKWDVQSGLNYNTGVRQYRAGWLEQDDLLGCWDDLSEIIRYHNWPRNGLFQEWAIHIYLIIDGLWGICLLCLLCVFWKKMTIWLWKFAGMIWHSYNVYLKPGVISVWRHHLICIAFPIIKIRWFQNHIIFILIWRCHLTSMGFPIIKIRWSWDHLIFIMGNPILVR